MGAALELVRPASNPMAPNRTESSMPNTKKSRTTATPKKAENGATPQVDLIYQALETELGGVEIYTTALECVKNRELRKEWEEYLEQTKQHVEVVRELCDALNLDPERETPGRKVVRHIGKALVKAMQMALAEGDAKAAEIVAAECVTLAETKDHANWSLISKLGEKSTGKKQEALEGAAEQVEDEEDEHLYHSAGWARELWFQALKLPAQLPPPEEEQDVKSEEQAARVKKQSVRARLRAYRDRTDSAGHPRPEVVDPGARSADPPQLRSRLLRTLSGNTQRPEQLTRVAEELLARCSEGGRNPSGLRAPVSAPRASPRARRPGRRARPRGGSRRPACGASALR